MANETQTTGTGTPGKSPRFGAIQIGIIIALIVAVGVAVYMKKPKQPSDKSSSGRMSQLEPTVESHGATGLPRLIDLGAGKCIPCKMMAPILAELKVRYQGKIEVEFIDVWEDPGAGKAFGIQLIPTQIFYDASGKERFRHEGFMAKEDILAKWKELGVDLAVPSTGVSRTDPLKPDTRPPSSICYMCDGDVNPKTRVTLKTDKGDVVLCSPHCYFILYSSLLETQGIHEKVTVTDWPTGTPLPALTANYLLAMEGSGRPVIKAFGSKESALKEQQSNGGNLLTWQQVQEKELATRCGFCDRAVYPEDACRVKVDGIQTWGCCPMCALGVAARTQKDIEVHAKDFLTGEMIRVKTTNGYVSTLEPATAVAWAGQQKGAEGQMVSAGCFKQAIFANEVNLKQWLDQHPAATGKMISVAQALAEKMKLTPQQISKACKIGECSPK